MVKHYVYALICPLDNKIRYIGKTKNPKSRWKQHCKDVGTTTKKKKWITHLRNNKMNPGMKIISHHDSEEEARGAEEKAVIDNIDTIYNIHMPGKGSKSVDFFKKTGKTN